MMSLSKFFIIFSIFAITMSISYSFDKKFDRLLSEEELPYLLNGSNAGTLYYMTFHPCWEETGPNNAIRIYVSSAVKTKVTLEVAGKKIYMEKQTIPNDIIEFALEPLEAQPYSKGSGAYPIPPKPEQVWKDVAIKLFSEAPIVVYGVTRFQYTSDGYLALPVTSLGKDYQVASYADPTNNTGQFLPSYTSIVGVYDSTEVTFRLGGCESCQVPLENGEKLRSGQVISRTINEGDVWLIPGIGPFNDLTGSKINADKPIAVISGNFCAYIPTHIAACDFLIEQELPEETWGSKIYVSPIVSRKKYSVIKIFTKNPNTEVSIDGLPMFNIKTSGGVLGTGYIEARAGESDVIKPVIIHSKDNQPINVVQYNPGQQDDNVPSDPFQMQLTPQEQFQKEIVFNTPGINGGFGFRDNYINIVYKATKDGKIPDDIYFAEIINGQANWIALKDYSSNPGMPFEYDKPDENNRIYYSKILRLPKDGVYKIKSDESFAAYSYGFSDYDSYGFPTSVAVADLEKQDTIPPILSSIENKYDNELSGEIIDEPRNDEKNRSNLSLIFMDPLKSDNFKFSTDKYIANDDYIVKWKLSKIDNEKPSKAHLVINDRNGNRFDTIITMQAVKPNLRRSDSLVLVSIFNINNGLNWKDKSNWLTSRPIDEWAGVILNDNRVIELDFSGKGLTGVLSTEISKLSKLNKLNLSNNLNCVFSDDLEITEQLEYINISNCNLKYYPSFLLKSTNLKEINLSENSINELPIGIDNNNNLEILDLSKNNLDFSDLIAYKFLLDNPNFSFIYYPQRKIGNRIEVKVQSSESYLIDFDINESSNLSYNWFHNDSKLEQRTSKSLLIKNFDKENTGSYYLRISNSDFPKLNLESEQCVLSIIPGKPLINANLIYDITESSAKIDIEITNSGGDDILLKGVCWNEEGNPTLTDYKTEVEGDSKGFVAKISNLRPDKTYFIRAFAINNQGISYSQEKSFNTNTTFIPDESSEKIIVKVKSKKIEVNLKEVNNIEYQLLDLNGNIITFGNCSNHNEIVISTQNLAKGIYFLEIKGIGVNFCKKLILE